jgi:predicted phosphodiesterase
MKLLLISDMHIMCTVPAVEPWLYRWDADRYLRMNIETAVKYVNPDAVILMGDVFDQGYIATEQQWKEYLECLQTIVHLPPHTKLMVTVGDNDIGGEGREVIKSSLLTRYMKEFGPMNSVEMIRNVAFVKVNTVPLLRMLPADSVEANARQSIVDFVQDSERILKKNKTTNVVVMFGHIPVKEMNDRDTFQFAVGKLKPSFYFAGHVHYSTHSRYSMQSYQLEEHVLPTSSYRMGQMYAGLGVVTIDLKGELTFAVLWFPSRFPLLALLFIEIVLFILFNVYQFTCSPRR